MIGNIASLLYHGFLCQFWPKLGFLVIILAKICVFDFSSKFVFFDPILDFWSKFGVLSIFQIFGQNLEFWSLFGFLVKFWSFDPILNFWSNFWSFVIFLGIFGQNLVKICSNYKYIYRYLLYFASGVMIGNTFYLPYHAFLSISCVAGYHKKIDKKLFN